VPQARSTRETFINQLKRDTEKRKGQRANQKKNSDNKGRRSESEKGRRNKKGNNKGV
jgi:hypothetical protein